MRKSSLKEVNNEDSSNSNSEIITRENITDTPFTIIGIEKGFFVVIGEYRLTEIGTYSACMEFIDNKSWNNITSVIMIIVEKLTKKQ